MHEFEKPTDKKIFTPIEKLGTRIPNLSLQLKEKQKGR